MLRKLAFLECRAHEHYILFPVLGRKDNLEIREIYKLDKFNKHLFHEGTYLENPEG